MLFRSDKHLDLYLKYDNEDDFVEAYVDTIPDKEIDMTNGLDVAKELEDILSRQINLRILGKLFWMGRDEILKRYYRTKKLERICK